MKKTNTEIVQNIVSIVRQKIEEKKLTHEQVSNLTKQIGEGVSAKTVGNMLNNPTSTRISSLLNVCDALGLNLTAILHAIESDLNSENTMLFFDINHAAYSGYTGEYHVFFLSTLPSKNPSSEDALVHGTLKLGDFHSAHECTAILDIDIDPSEARTGTEKQPSKHYEGVLVYSSNGMMFCNLIGYQYGDMWFLVFKHGNLNINDLACVLGCAATCSAGRTTRFPAVHRFCLCNKQKYPDINTHMKQHIQGLLRLQNDELFVEQKALDDFLQRTDLDSTFRKNLENHLNVAGTYRELSKDVLKNKVDPTVFANSISELCQISAQQKTYYILPNDDDALTNILLGDISNSSEDNK